MLTILNDVHIGVTRVAGTTVQTSAQLREHIISRFDELLPDTDLMILGDLFDTSNIPMSDFFKTYVILDKWCKKGRALYLVRGNHDISKAGALSSFDLLGKLLTLAHRNAQVLTQPTRIEYGYVIPHADNQDLFDFQLKEAPEADIYYLHCNVMNTFAVNSDHSLNINLEQIAAAKCKQIVCAHEHSDRKVGKVLLPGNQIATSVSDWLASESKYLTQVDAGVAKTVLIGKREEEYSECDWQDLKDQGLFIRVTGEASTSQAQEVVSAVSRFRQSSNAFVITNNVNIVSEDGSVGSFQEALEKAQKFDLMEILKQYLTPEEFSIVKGLK